MREINLPMTQTFSITFTPQMFDESKAVDMGNGQRRILLGNICDPQIGEVVETARRNGGKILYATTSIEQTLENILLNYFMGRFVGHEDRRVMFEHEVLQSSALSYRAKKELVTKIINNEALLEGKKKSKVQGHLGPSWNGVTHLLTARFSTTPKKAVSFAIIPVKPRTITLDDKFWDDVEKTYQESVELLKESEQQLEKNQQTK